MTTQDIVERLLDEANLSLEDYGSGNPYSKVLWEAADHIRQLQRQLPSGMQHCTIQFKECPLGHGTLTATNWVQHPCQKCKTDMMESMLRETSQFIYPDRADSASCEAEQKDLLQRINALLNDGTSNDQIN